MQVGAGARSSVDGGRGKNVTDGAAIQSTLKSMSSQEDNGAAHVNQVLMTPQSTGNTPIMITEYSNSYRPKGIMVDLIAACSGARIN